MKTWIQWGGASPTPIRMAELTRDDLIRLVVGMQWVEAMGYMLVVDGQVVGIMFPYSMPWGRGKTAVDIVDEWLGVR